MELYQEDVEVSWDTNIIKENLYPFEKYFKKRTIRPSGMIRNMAVFVNEKIIRIEGSIAKYHNKNNVENFDFRDFKYAITSLSDELGVDLENARIRRIDIAANFELENEVSDYFPDLHSLKYFQRDSSKKTTLRFYSNSERRSLVFYDKINEFVDNNKKFVKDDTSLIDTFHNLIRYEYMIQSKVSKHLEIADMRVKDLFKPENSRKVLKLWFDMYNKIHKQSLLVYPNVKGLKGYENFLKRYIAYTLGMENIEYYLKYAVKKGLLSFSDKSKKMKQFDVALNLDSSLTFRKTTTELNYRIKIMYVEGLKQIFKMTNVY